MADGVEEASKEPGHPGAWRVEDRPADTWFAVAVLGVAAFGWILWAAAYGPGMFFAVLSATAVVAGLGASLWFSVHPRPPLGVRLVADLEAIGGASFFLLVPLTLIDPSGITTLVVALGVFAWALAFGLWRTTTVGWALALAWHVAAPLVTLAGSLGVLDGLGSLSGSPTLVWDSPVAVLGAGAGLLVAVYLIVRRDHFLG